MPGCVEPVQARAASAASRNIPRSTKYRYKPGHALPLYVRLSWVVVLVIAQLPLKDFLLQQELYWKYSSYYPHLALIVPKSLLPLYENEAG